MIASIESKGVSVTLDFKDLDDALGFASSVAEETALPVRIWTRHNGFPVYKVVEPE